MRASIQLVSGTICVVALVLLFSTYGCQTSVNVSTESLKEKVRDEFMRWELLGDPTLIDECYTADCVWHGPGGMEMKGHEGLKQLMAMLNTAFPDRRYTVHDLIAEGDKVVARWTLEATHRGEYMGVPATGKQVTMDGIYIIRFVDGKQAEWWLQADFAGMMQQLAALPTAKEGGK